MDSGGCPRPIESLIKKAFILEASGLAGSRARFLASGRWPLLIESLITGGSYFEGFQPGRLQGQISGFWRVAASYGKLNSKSRRSVHSV